MLIRYTGSEKSSPCLSPCLMHRMACRCFWDSDTDNYAQDIYMNVSAGIHYSLAIDERVATARVVVYTIARGNRVAELVHLLHMHEIKVMTWTGGVFIMRCSHLTHGYTAVS